MVSLEICANYISHPNVIRLYEIPNAINCSLLQQFVSKIINLSNDFGAKTFHCLVERRVKTEDPFSTFAIEVKSIINSEIFKIFIKLFFLGDIF